MSDPNTFWKLQPHLASQSILHLELFGQIYNKSLYIDLKKVCRFSLSPADNQGQPVTIGNFQIYNLEVDDQKYLVGLAPDKTPTSFVWYFIQSNTPKH